LTKVCPSEGQRTESVAFKPTRNIAKKLWKRIRTERLMEMPTSSMLIEYAFDCKETNRKRAKEQNKADEGGRD
jgi:hypothetical protein